MTQETLVKKDVYMLARELSETLAETAELQAYRRTEDVLLGDPEALALINRYETAKRAVKFSKTEPKEVQAKLVEEFLQVEEAFEAHTEIQAYWSARENLDRLVDRLNQIITYPITGTEAPKTKGGCGSGGGGCGCGS